MTSDLLQERLCFVDVDAKVACSSCDVYPSPRLDLISAHRGERWVSASFISEAATACQGEREEGRNHQ